MLKLVRHDNQHDNMSVIPDKIISRCIADKPKTAEELNAVKRLVLRASPKTAHIPTSSALLKSYHKLVKNHRIKTNKNLEKLFVKRAVRTLSGVSIVTVLTKPFPCPGQCVYCPNEKDMPKSYISDEPAAARALMLKFDPYEQVARRLESLEANGHPTDKIELIVKGGTWNAYPVEYQYWFALRCFEACNQMSLRARSKRAKQSPAATVIPATSHTTGLKKAGICDIATADSRFSSKGGPASGGHGNDNDANEIAALLSVARNDMKKAQTKNESAKHRIIGLTLETRPDFIDEKNIKIMRELGCTRVELGVQTIDDKILKLIKRGHDAAEVRRATALLKNYGFKVDYHLMPQLPGSTPARDLKMMREIFVNPAYRPDMIKIYPCTVVKNSELYRWIKKGAYEPYSDKKLIDVLKKIKTAMPRYVRISRLIRDIPAHHIIAGNKMTNLRQVIQKEMAEEGLKCNCLRCREIGHQKNIKNTNKNPKLFVDKYAASGGTEYFLSYEDAGRNIVYAFCRLRINSSVIPTIQAVIPAKAGIHATVIPAKAGICRRKVADSRFRGNDTAAIIRELHVYGQTLAIGKKEKFASQHKGLGKKLMDEATKICRRAGVKTLAVISGVGARGYYKKMGFSLKGTYMVKYL